LNWKILVLVKIIENFQESKLQVTEWEVLSTSFKMLIWVFFIAYIESDSICICVVWSTVVNTLAIICVIWFHLNLVFSALWSTLISIKVKEGSGRAFDTDFNVVNLSCFITFSCCNTYSLKISSCFCGLFYL
jgi:hypothetical protein